MDLTLEHLYSRSLTRLKKYYDVTIKVEHNYIFIQKENISFVIAFENLNNYELCVCKYKGLLVPKEYDLTKLCVSLRNDQFIFLYNTYGVSLYEFIMQVDEYLQNIHLIQCKNLLFNMHYLLNNNLIIHDIYSYIKSLVIWI